MIIEYNNDFKKTDPFQLRIIIHTQDKATMLDHMEKIMAELKSIYGKPNQGTYTQYYGVRNVVTPIWASGEY